MDQNHEKNIIRGILEHKNQVIENVYQECFPMVERMIINTGGNSDQAKDIFQEGWIIIYRKINSGELLLTCKFSTYIYAVCKKLWFQEKRKNKTRQNKIASEMEIVEEPMPMFNEDQEEMRKLFHKHFNDLSEDCQKIMILHINMASIEEIRNIMNYDNSHYAMDRKYRCKKSLLQRILNDPNFKTLKNEYSEQIRSLF